MKNKDNLKNLYDLKDAAFLALLTILLIASSKLQSPALAKTIDPPANIQTSDFLSNSVPAVTIRSHQIIKITEYEPINFETIYQDDNNLAWGKEKIVKKGSQGQRTYNYEITLWQGNEVSRRLLNATEVPPKNQIVKVGKKVIWSNFESPDGKVNYWHKIDVFATSYDSTCLGCDEWTATGTKLRKGTIAVDTSVIPLGTKLYVPGYGFGIAEDTGGAIIGNRIDLGFASLADGEWSAHTTTIYILSGAPI